MRPTFDQLVKQISPGQYGTAAMLTHMIPDNNEDIYTIQDPGYGTLLDLKAMASREFKITDQHGTVHTDKVLSYIHNEAEKTASVKFSDYLI